MTEKALFEAIKRIEEEQKQLQCLILSMYKALTVKGLISPDEIKDAYAIVAADLQDAAEQEARTGPDSELHDHELAIRREFLKRGMPQLPSGVFEAEFMRELEIKAEKPGHHYHFVHQQFRDAFFEGQEAFLATMANPEECNMAVKQLWQRTCDACSETGVPEFGAADIAVQPLIMLGFPAVMLYMPPPDHIMEAYLAIAALLVPVESLQATMLREPPEMVFITLERSCYDMTVLGAWINTRRQFIGLAPHIIPDEPGTMPALFFEAVETLVKDSWEELAWKPAA